MEPRAKAGPVRLTTGEGAMIVAHLSDFHVSRYGTHMGDMRSGRQRFASDNGAWEPFEVLGGWRIDVRKERAGRRRLAFRLVDEHGALHVVLKAKRSQGDVENTELVKALRVLRAQRIATDYRALAADMPSPEAIARGLCADPDNWNLRFCAAAHAVCEANPDWVIITGDLTDDGMGYELIEAGLAPFIARKRLVCVPGNHDVYATPALWTARKLRSSEEVKRMRWAEFATRIGQPASPWFTQELGPGVVLACLDSCHPPNSPLSASGLIPLRQLHAMAGALQASKAGVRLACLHHHVVNPPTNGLGMRPFQPGMRLRNAREVLERLSAMGFALVMNGHRHVGYQFMPASGPLFLSAPSSTGGCRSGASPYFWVFDVDGRGVHRISRQTIPLLVAPCAEIAEA